MNKNNSFSWVNDITSNAGTLFFILGPCVMENEAHVMFMAEALKKLSEKIQSKFIFKSSFDKANRTSLDGYRGVGLHEGLAILSKVRTTFDIPVVTDVHESIQVNEIAQVVDVIQIPAFLCRQTDLLLAAGRSGKVVHVKKGQFVAPEIMGSIYKKIESTGCKNIWGCERGFTLGYGNLVVDYRNFPILKSFGKPVVFDATHAVQRPSSLGCKSGGDRSYIPALASAAVVQGVAGIFMEVHDQPETALCDGPNSVRLSQLESLLLYLMDLDAWVKSKKIPELT